MSPLEFMQWMTALVALVLALAPGAKPRFDTVLKVARALGVKLTAQPAWRGGDSAGNA